MAGWSPLHCLASGPLTVSWGVSRPFQAPAPGASGWDTEGPQPQVPRPFHRPGPSYWKTDLEK